MNIHYILLKILKLSNKYLRFIIYYVILYEDASITNASVAELVDAADSKSAGSNTLRVRFPSLAPNIIYNLPLIRGFFISILTKHKLRRIIMKEIFKSAVHQYYKKIIKYYYKKEKDQNYGQDTMPYLLVI